MFAAKLKTTTEVRDQATTTLTQGVLSDTSATLYVLDTALEYALLPIVAHRPPRQTAPYRQGSGCVATTLDRRPSNGASMDQHRHHAIQASGRR